MPATSSPTRGVRLARLCSMTSLSQRDRARDLLSRERRLRPEAAPRPAARRPRVSEHVFRRHVQSGLPDDLPAVQRSARHRVRARVPAAQAGAAGAGRVRRAHRVARIADAGQRLRRLRVLRLVRVGLHQRPHAAAAGRPAAARRGTRPPPSAHPDRRRGDVRQSRAAGAVCRRHRRRRRRSRSCRPSWTPCSSSTSRTQLLETLAGKRGYYVPSFYDVEYADGRQHRALRAEDGTGVAPPVVRKAALKTTEAVDPPSTSIFTPDTEFGSRFLVEVVRGCANLCRFCWAGYNYLPVRAFPTDRILELARSGARRSPHASAWSRSRSAITRTSSTSCAA